MVAGEPTGRDKGWETARRGVCYIPEGGGIFNELSVAENLDLARGDRPKASLEEVFEMFPVLGGRLAQRSASLSGGEKRMLAMSRAVLTKPRVVLVDELSLGLAPAIVTSLLGVLRRLQQDGSAVVLVEQHVSAALDFAQWAWVLVKGRTSFKGEAAELSDSEVLESAYLGHANASHAGPGRDRPGTPSRTEHPRPKVRPRAAARSGNGTGAKRRGGLTDGGRHT